MAKEFNLKLVVQAIDRVTSPVRKMGSAMGDMARRSRLDALAAKLRTALGRMAHKARESLMRMGGGAWRRSSRTRTSGSTWMPATP